MPNKIKKLGVKRLKSGRLLETGKKARLTNAEEAIVKKAVTLAQQTGATVMPHMCFSNAQAVFCADHTHIEGSRQLCYHEGYIPSSYGAAPHAWLSINGKIVDPTLQADAENAGINFEVLFKKIDYYFAEKLPASRVLEFVRDPSKSGSIRGLVGGVQI